MSSLFLRSAAGRVLRRPISQGSFSRSPGRFFSDGAGRIKSEHSCSKPALSPQARFEMTLDKLDDNLSKAQEQIRILIEKEKRFEQRQQRQKVLSLFLVPAAIAFWVFCPDKKDNLSGV